MRVGMSRPSFGAVIRAETPVKQVIGQFNSENPDVALGMSGAMKEFEKQTSKKDLCGVLTIKDVRQDNGYVFRFNYKQLNDPPRREMEMERRVSKELFTKGFSLFNEFYEVYKPLKEKYDAYKNIESL